MNVFISFFVVILIISCSTGQEFESVSSTSKVKTVTITDDPSTDNLREGEPDSSATEDQGDIDENVAATHPTVISGSFLVCHVMGSEEDNHSVNIGCSLFINDQIQLFISQDQIRIRVHGSDQSESLTNFTLNQDGSFTFTIPMDHPGAVDIIANNGTNQDHFEKISTNIPEEKVREILNKKNKNAPSEKQEPSATEPTPEPEPAKPCDTITAGGHWVFVPGDPDYNTQDFCVMKYEAKNKENSPHSQADQEPWTSIGQADAAAACQSLGASFHLMTNPEWMTIGSNLASVDSNWSGGIAGAGELSRGHSDASPLMACPASGDDKPYVDASCTGEPAGPFNQRRTLSLSSQQMIWDISGNVREWVDYINNTDKPGNQNAWFEYSDLTGTALTPLRDLIPTNAVKSFWNDLWNSDQSIGQFFPFTNGTGGGLNRGGAFDDEDRSGVFHAMLNNNPTAVSGKRGFRCTVPVPAP